MGKSASLKALIVNGSPRFAGEAGKWLMGLALLFTIYYSLFTAVVLAQNVPTLGGVAVNIVVNDTDIVQGDIISTTQNGFKRSNVEYDSSVFGVVINAPILSVEPRAASTVAVISSGETQVRVSTVSGNIEVGDLITTSTTAGVGQKAVKNGYVVGKALQAYSDSAKPGLISVLVSPSIGSAVSTKGGSSLFGIATDPKNSKYLIAAIVAIVTALGAIAAFIRLITTGVLAIGRNPLAKSTILRAIIIAAGVITILAIAGAAAVVGIITLS